MPQDKYTCTRPPGHAQSHAAHTLFGTVVAVWDDPSASSRAGSGTVETFIQFGDLTDTELADLAAWCVSVLDGFRGSPDYAAVERFFVPLSQMALGLQALRFSKKSRTATFLLDRSLVAETQTTFLGFIDALIRGQRDSYSSQGRPRPAAILTIVLTFIQAELNSRGSDEGGLAH